MAHTVFPREIRKKVLYAVGKIVGSHRQEGETLLKYSEKIYDMDPI